MFWVRKKYNGANYTFFVPEAVKMSTKKVRLEGAGSYLFKQHYLLLKKGGALQTGHRLSNTN
jgi:hypothetical protein